MAQQELDPPEIDAGFEEMRRKGVTKHMRMDGFPGASEKFCTLGRAPLQHAGHARCGDVLLAATLRGLRGASAQGHIAVERGLGDP